MTDVSPPKSTPSPTSGSTKSRSREIDEKFPFSEYEKVCVDVLQELYKEPGCMDFVPVPDWSTFQHYSDYVQEPLTLCMVESRLKESGKGKKIAKVSTFYRKVRQVFVNALRYWRLYDSLRIAVYQLLGKFSALMFEKLPGLQDIIQRDRLIQGDSLAVCRTAVDRILASAKATKLLLPYNYKASKEPPNFVALAGPSSDICIIDVVTRLNTDYYTDLEHFYNEAISSLQIWVNYYTNLGQVQHKTASEAKKLMRLFKVDMKSVYQPAGSDVPEPPKDLEPKVVKVKTEAKKKKKKKSSNASSSKSSSKITSISGSRSSVSQSDPLVENAMKSAMDKLDVADTSKLFKEPVDWKSYGLLDYPKVVKRPMDFGTIRKMIPKYSSMTDFISDVKLVFSNCELYNQNPKDPIRIHCKTVKKAFENIIATVLEPIMSIQSTNVTVPAASDKTKKSKTKKRSSSMTSASGATPSISSGFPESSACLSVMKDIMKMKESQPFHFPVDWKQLKLPEYPKIIKRPMDFGTVVSNLKKGKYTNVEEFRQDVEQVFTNCTTYNKGETPEFPILTWCEKVRKKFHSKFEAKLRDSELKRRSASPASSVASSSACYPKSECKSILEYIKRLPAAHPFLVPVNPKEVPGYTDVVKHPMDLKTVGSKLKSYTSAEEFANDMRLIFNNALLFNQFEQKEYPIRTWATELLADFEKKYEEKIVKPPSVKAIKTESKDTSKIAKAPTQPPQDEVTVKEEEAPPPPPPPEETIQPQKVTIKIPPKRKHESLSLTAGSSGSKSKKKKGGFGAGYALTGPVPAIKPTKFEPPVPPKRNLSPFETSVQEAILKLGKSEWGNKYFGRPVLESWPNLAEPYLAVVQQPMDLRTILQKLYFGDGVYKTINDVAVDVELMFDNAYNFNSDDSPATKILRSHFDLVKQYYKYLISETPTWDSEEREKNRKERQALLVDDELGSLTSNGVRLMKKLMHSRNKNCIPFLDPVDTAVFKDYLTIVKKPMDLTTLKRRVEAGEYNVKGGVGAFQDDVRLIFDNCLLYNRKENPDNAKIREMATTMLTMFNSEWGMMTCHMYEKKFRLELILKEKIELDLATQLTALGPDPSQEEIDKLRSRIEKKHYLEQEKAKKEAAERRAGRKKSKRAKSESISDNMIVSTSIKSSMASDEEEDDEFDADDLMFDGPDDDEEFSPRSRPHMFNSSASSFKAKLGASATTFRPPVKFKQQQIYQQKKYNVAGTKDYEKFETSVSRAKKESLKRAKLVLAEQKAKEMQALRRKERDCEIRNEMESRLKNPHQALEKEEIEKAQGLKFTFVKRRKKKTNGVIAKQDEEEEQVTEEEKKIQQQWHDQVLQASKEQEEEKAAQQPLKKLKPNDDAAVVVKCIVSKQPVCEDDDGESGAAVDAKGKKARKKGKQVHKILVTAVKAPTISARVSQRIVHIEGLLPLCFGVVLLTVSSVAEDLKREQLLSTTVSPAASATAVSPANTCHRAVERVKMSNSGSLDGPSAPVYVPIPKEHRSEPDIPFDVSFSMARTEADVFERTVNSVLCDENSSSTDIARSFLEKKGEAGHPLQDWIMHRKHGVMTCKPETQERGSRIFVVVRYIAIAGNLNITVGGHTILKA